MLMGHSPRKASPVFYVGNYPVSRLMGIRSLSMSPHSSPKRGGQPHHRSSMQPLRMLVLAALSLLVLSLLYIQFASAVTVPSSRLAAAGVTVRSHSSTQHQGGAKDAAAAAGGLAPDRQQRQLAATATGIAQQVASTTAAAAAAAAVKAATAAAPADPPAGGFPAPGLTHLVLVAGHAVYTGLDFAVANQESSWFLEPYQQVPGEAQSFLDHIKLGIETAARDPGALLLFSGGQTRKAAGPRSEGLSYWLAAEAAGWYGHPDVRGRAYTEEHARDSFENLLFSLCRFYEITGHYPSRVTAVSYTLKQQRFESLHRAAVRFPAHSFTFVGTPIPPAAKGAKEGEAATVAAFVKDPYGCSGALLAKKSRRDPFAVGAPHPSRCPEMAGLLLFCGSKTYTGPVPWDLHPGGAGKALSGRKSSRSGIYT